MAGEGGFLILINTDQNMWGTDKTSTLVSPRTEEQQGDYKKFSDKIFILPEEEKRFEDHVGNSDIAQLTYNVCHMNCLPTDCDLHGDSPQQPQNCTQTMQDPPISILINNKWTFYIEF